MRRFEDAAEEDTDAAAKADRLRHEIEQADYAYYVSDNPSISDAEYDVLMQELRSLEERFPELRTPESPTVRVAGEVAAGFRPYRHAVPMLSLGNAFTHEQLDSWLQRLRNALPKASFAFVCEPKIDGLAISLTYVNGVFRLGATRGNGIEGEDVTANLKTIADIPPRLRGDQIPRKVEVRGEVYTTTVGFESLNERRAEEGASLFANPRNSAAGSLRQLNPEVTATRPLSLWAYALGLVDGMEIESQWQALARFREWGFPVNPLDQLVGSMQEVQEYCDRMQVERDRLPYEIDGCVIKVDSIPLQQELGFVGREPRWAIAFKFPPRQATTRLLAIDVNVGRTGTINPYAVLEPVTVGGVVVRTATLHNEEDIRRKDIRVGDRVIVQRAGDVIPQVVKPLPEERDGTQRIYELPTLCPFCNTTIVRTAGEAMAYCPNSGCPQQRLRWLEHFVSEPAMDIRGLGFRQVQHLLEHGLIETPADIYTLTREQLLRLPGVQERTANSLLRSIERSKTRPLDNLIFALGIRFVGGQTAQLLAQAFGNLDALAQASVEDLESIEGIGNKTGESIAEWMGESKNLELLQNLKRCGLNWQASNDAVSTGILSGKNFLLTGRLEAMSRSQAEGRLRDLGAKIATGMSKSVDYLIAGEEAGSKLAKAEKLGTPIRDEEWLVTLFETGSLPNE